MKLFSVLISLFTLSSCTLLSGEKRLSNWDVLDNVGSMSCDTWPLAENDLGVEDAFVLRDKSKVGLMVHMRKRNGSYSYIYAPFKGSTDIDLDDVTELFFGSDGIPLNGDYANGEKFVGVVRPVENNSSVLEIRDLSSNVVKSTTKISKSEISKGQLIKVEKGAWSICEEDNYVIDYITESKSKISTKRFTQSFQSLPAVIRATNSNDVNVLNFENGTKPGFFLREFKANGSIGGKKKLEISTEAGIESWASTEKAGGFKLAYVEGDSIVGESNLKISSFSIGYDEPKLDWNKEQSLSTLHVSEPVWVSSPAEDWVLLLKWIDGEATMGSYKVGSTGVEQSENIGVFEKGAALIDAFAFGEESDIYAITRNRSGRYWQFNICELSGLK